MAYEEEEPFSLQFIETKGERTIKGMTLKNFSLEYR